MNKLIAFEILILLSKKIGHDKTRMAILSATESPISSIPSSVKAKELEVWTRDNYAVSYTHLTLPTTPYV